MRRRPERGQALVETALAAPILVLFTLGLLQVGQALWVRVRLQVAVQEAARAYTVWQPDGEEEATAKAKAAAWLALRPRPRLKSWDLSVEAWKPSDAGPITNDRWKDAGALTHHLTLRATLPPIFGLRRLFPDGMELAAETEILSEDSQERKALRDD